MNFEFLTQPNKYQVKNLLIQGVKLKLTGYDDSRNINDDLVQVTLISRAALYDENKKLILKNSSSDILIDNTQSKQIVEKVYNLLVDIKDKKKNSEIYKFDKFEVEPIKKYDQIDNSTIDYIRINIVDPFAQNMIYKEGNNLRYRWLIGSFPLLSCITNKMNGQNGPEFELEFKSMKIPEVIKNQVDENHQFYLVFTLMRSIPSDYPIFAELYNGFDYNEECENVNTCIRRNIGFVMSTLTTTYSSSFIFTNKKLF